MIQKVKVPILYNHPSHMAWIDFIERVNHLFCPQVCMYAEPLGEYLTHRRCPASLVMPLSMFPDQKGNQEELKAMSRVNAEVLCVSAPHFVHTGCLKFSHFLLVCPMKDDVLFGHCYENVSQFVHQGFWMAREYNQKPSVYVMEGQSPLMHQVFSEVKGQYADVMTASLTEEDVLTYITHPLGDFRMIFCSQQQKKLIKAIVSQTLGGTKYRMAKAFLGEDNVSFLAQTGRKGLNLSASDLLTAYAFFLRQCLSSDLSDDVLRSVFQNPSLQEGRKIPEDLSFLQHDPKAHCQERAFSIPVMPKMHMSCGKDIRGFTISVYADLPLAPFIDSLTHLLNDTPFALEEVFNMHGVLFSKEVSLRQWTDSCCQKGAQLLKCRFMKKSLGDDLPVYAIARFLEQVSLVYHWRDAVVIEGEFKEYHRLF